VLPAFILLVALLVLVAAVGLLLSTKVEEQTKKTGEQVAALGKQVTTVAEEQAAAHRSFRDELEGARRELARLRRELEQLEGLLRRQHGCVPVDLDGVPADLLPLVEDVRRAEQIRATLLDDRARGFRQQQIRAYERGRSELADTRREALAAARRLATGKDGGLALHRSATAYRKARARLRGQEADLAKARAIRDEAERELDQDARQQQAFRAHPGAAVADRLAAHVRRQIDAALAGYELLPAWFTIVLRHRPPATRAAEWRDAAVQLVLYRMTYEITDPVVALGPDPSGGHRLARHDAVRAALLRLDDTAQSPA
jgi:hypothetical protein